MTAWAHKERRVLVTGSRDWEDRDLVEAALLAETDPSGLPMVLIHGGARGLDRVAADLAGVLGWREVPFPVKKADWRYHGRAAGPLRNQKMVDYGADICLAFPLPKSQGTWDCLRRAKAAGIPTKVLCG